MNICPTLDDKDRNDLIPKEETKSLENLIVTYGKTVEQKIEQKLFNEIFNVIKTGKGIASAIELIRAEQDIEKRRGLKKKHLPWFNLGMFNNQRKNEDLIKTRYIVIDFDHVGELLDELREKIEASKYVFCAFTSPSGDGLKVIFRLDHDVTNQVEYERIYNYYCKQLEEQYGYKPDHTKDCSRACFLSHDPDIYINWDCNELVTEGLEIQIPNVSSNTKNGKKQELLASLAGTTPGNRTHTLTRVIGLFYDRGFDIGFTSEMCLAWNEKNKPPLPDEKVIATVDDLYERNNKKYHGIPVRFELGQNAYYKRTNNNGRIQVTSFTIKPKELLVLDDGDCLQCDITTSQNYKYENILIENTDWHSKQKFLKAIGHQDCNFFGSENDLQSLCSFVNVKVPVRKTGTKVIGLHDTHWVVQDMNITSSGILPEPEIVPYEKGADAFYHGIDYALLEKPDYNVLVSGIYNNVTNINQPEVVLPWIGWTFASVVKPNIMSWTGSFPLVFVHGGQGSGKTSTGKLFKRLCGYTDSSPVSCTLRSFPMLKMLSSTNAIPVLFDEFKQSDMKEEQIDNLLRFMRKSYAGEVESKGKADQTVEDYLLQAPITVMGEWSISQPAIKERILLIRFTDIVKKNAKMREAFERLNELPLEGFMPRYIQFCLGQDIHGMYDRAKRIVNKHFANMIVAPRILSNLTVMILGLMLFKKFGRSYGVSVPKLKVKELLDNQLKEITGSSTGFVKSAVDQLMEELSVMVQNAVIKPEDYKVGKVGALNVLAIRFRKIFPEFKNYAQRTKYEGDLLNHDSYMNLFEDCDYVVHKSQPFRFGGNTTHRCLIIDVDKIKKTGIDMAGFGI